MISSMQKHKGTKFHCRKMMAKIELGITYRDCKKSFYMQANCTRMLMFTLMFI